MTDRLSKLLAERPWLLADGATGTNLFAVGLETGDSPELWNVDRPDRIRDLHRGFLEAGSDIILTNSFGGSAYRLKLHRAEARVRELNRAAAALAREVADEIGAAQGREIVVAGSMGPTGEIFAPLGSLSLEDGTAAFAEQAAALAEGGADVLWIETISSVEELTAAIAGAQASGLPYVCTLSFDTNGRTMMGVTPAALVRQARGHAPGPLGFGGNCGTGASELMAAIVNMGESRGLDDVIIAKSNCGIPEYKDGQIVYSGTPALMADYARLARDAGVRIIGGCCGTTAAHLSAMRAALEGYEPGAAPDLEMITAKLGAISAGATTQGGGTGADRLDASEGRSQRRGRRRSRPARDTPAF